MRFLSIQLFAVLGLLVFVGAVTAPGAAAQETLTPEKERAFKRLEELGFVRNYAIDGADMIAEAGKGNLEAVKLFLTVGIDPDLQDTSGQSAIFTASENGHIDIVTALLDAGASMQMKDDLGRTPLVFAVQRDQSEVARLLLERSEAQ